MFVVVFLFVSDSCFDSSVNSRELRTVPSLHSAISAVVSVMPVQLDVSDSPFNL